MNWKEWVLQVSIATTMMILFVGAPKAHSQPLEVKQIICNQLVDDFEYMYKLRQMEIHEQVTYDIIVRNPAHSLVAAYVLDGAVRALYATPFVPDIPTWMLGTQIVCLKVIGPQLNPPLDWRFVYKRHRREI